LLKRRLDTTPPIYGVDRTPDGKILIIPVRPFELTPFMEKLGLRVFNTEGTPLFSWDMGFEEKFDMRMEEIKKINVHRVVVVERNVDPIVKPKKSNDKCFTPLFLVNYGEGKFLLSLIFENYSQNSGIKKWLLT